MALRRSAYFYFDLVILMIPVLAFRKKLKILDKGDYTASANPIEEAEVNL